MAKDYLKKYNGEWIKVTDNEIIESSVCLSNNTGLFSEPAAATAFAGLIKYNKIGKIPQNSKNLVLLTGSGLKDLNSVQNAINIPKAIEPQIKEVEKLLKLLLS